MPPPPSTHFWGAMVFGLVPTTWLAKMGGLAHSFPHFDAYFVKWGAKMWIFELILKMLIIFGSIWQKIHEIVSKFSLLAPWRYLAEFLLSCTLLDAYGARKIRRT